MADQATQPRPPGTIPGRWIVLAMLAFGMASTATIWGYWKLQLAPFLPLQQALLAEFPKSYPRVEGGRPKGAAPLLRIVLQLESLPEADDPRANEIADRVVALAGEHLDLSAYDTLELHLVHYIPEKQPERLKIDRPLGKQPGPASR